MKLEPRIELISEKKLIGVSVKMSLVNNKTFQLWHSFSPKIKSIANRVSSDRISMQVYGPTFHSEFNPNNEFEKWALVEVESIDNVREGMKPFILNGGLYAVFEYVGSSNDRGIFEDIFNYWLPKSKYILDNRPHFEILGEKYKNNDPLSEEEIWIPILVN